MLFSCKTRYLGLTELYKVQALRFYFAHHGISGDFRIKRVGESLRGQGKSRGATKMAILHGDFSLFWRLSCYDLPYQTQHRLVNIVKYELALLFTREPKCHCRCNHTRVLLCRIFCMQLPQHCTCKTKHHFPYTTVLAPHERTQLHES